jgi:hypothetical protein
VSVTINGVPQPATIAGGVGGFSVNFNTATLPASITPYTITYAYAGNGTTLLAAADHTSTALTVNLATPTVTVTVGTYIFNGSPQGPTAYTTNPTGDTGLPTWSYEGTGLTTYGPSATLPTLAGTYTATVSLAADSNFNAASSIATAFTITAGNTYSSWLTANAPATGFQTDTDGDGVPNGVENVLGSSPNTFNQGLTEVASTANSVTFKHTLNPTVASDVTYSYRWSTDLTEWKADGETNTGGTTATIVASAPVSGVVTVTITITGGPSTKLFGELVATQ